MTSSERDGLMVLVIGAFALIIALLVVGFGWYAGQMIRVDTAVIPTATLSNATPLPVRPPNPTATPRGSGTSPSVPSGSTPIPPEFPSATPEGYPGPGDTPFFPTEIPSPTSEFPSEEGSATPTPDTEPTPTLSGGGGTTPAPLPSVSPTTRLSPTATRPGTTPAATVSATPDPTPQPPATATQGGGYVPPTMAPIPTATPYP